MLVPIGEGLVFRTKETWPRTSAVYCHPVPREAWPREPELVEELLIVVDAHERYPSRFTHQQVRTERRGLRCGDYAVELEGDLVASVERKSLETSPPA